MATLVRNARGFQGRYSTDELEVAARVQQKLWPGEGLGLSGLEIAGHCRPVGAVGGDTFDFITLGPRELALSLADVSGKGLPAALMMASLQAILRSGVGHGAADLRGFLAVANRHFFESTEAQHYATLFFAVYDDRSRELRYVSCGHPAAILLGADGATRRLEATAGAFGMFESLALEVASIRFGARDTLIVFSDGLLEAGGGGGNELGELRLIEAARELLAETTDFRAFPESLVGNVVEQRGYRQTDDMTVVAARAR